MSARSIPSLLALCFLFASPRRATAGAACVETRVGVDTARPYEVLDTFMGASIGQTFVASSPAISAITVWTTPGATTIELPWHLFVTAIDSTGTPQFDSPLLDEYKTFELPADADHPRALEFAFDPPLQLPAAGTYYLAFKPGDCSGTMWLLAAADAYVDGSLWASTTHHFACTLPKATSLPSADLLFEVRLCTSATPSPWVSWGAVKATYR